MSKDGKIMFTLSEFLKIIQMFLHFRLGSYVNPDSGFCLLFNFVFLVEMTT